MFSVHVGLAIFATLFATGKETFLYNLRVNHHFYKASMSRKLYAVCQVLNPLFSNLAMLNLDPSTAHEFHDNCHSVTFIVLVNSHQR